LDFKQTDKSKFAALAALIWRGFYFFALTRGEVGIIINREEIINVYMRKDE